MYPEDLKYTETHEWVKFEESQKTVAVGITQYAVGQLSDIVFIELPKAGDRLKKGMPFGAIESVKAVFDLNSPVSGEVVEVNESLAADFDALKNDPYGKGWMMKVKTENQKELDALMNAEDYENFAPE